MRALPRQATRAGVGELPHVQIIFRVERGLRQRLQALDLDRGVNRQRREHGVHEFVGRGDAAEITVYKSVGNGTQNAALAALLLGVPSRR